MTIKITTKERKNGTRRVQISSNQKGRVDKSHRDRCNINSIMAKARKGAFIPITNKNALYGDFSTSQSFHETQNKIIQANQAFEALPSNIRKEFENDPGKLIDFLEDPRNEQKAVELGILKKEEKPKPVENVPPTPDADVETEK